MTFDDAFTKLLGHEGSYSNHPSDKGGKTNWGVTEAVAREHGYEGDMRDLMQATAKIIYKKSYWTPLKLEKMPEVLRFALFDAGVNSGPAQATKWLQRALGVPDDGVIGPVTLGTANFVDPQKTLSRFMGHRLEFMTNVQSWNSFGKGWSRRVASILKEA